MIRACLQSFTLMLTVSLASLAQEGAGTISIRMVDVDARALAMGGAFVAIADNYSASHWNPAGVAKAGGPRVGGMHTNKFGQGINVNLLSGIMPIANFALGVSFASSSITGIPRIDEEGNEIGTIDSNEILLMGSVEMALPGLGFVGGSIKSYSYTLAEERGSGLGFDAGVLIMGLIPNLSVGAVTFGLGGTLGGAKPAWRTDSVEGVVSDLLVSGLFKVGAAFTLPKVGLTVAADFDFGAEGMSVLHLGAELAIAGTPIAMRVGGISAAPGEAPGEVKFTRGAGVILKNLRLDVAFVSNRVLGGSWVISGEIVF